MAEAAPARGLIMSQALSPSRQGLRPLMIVAAVAGLLVAATLGLWAHYGTAVFYEMILAGLAFCF
jgi:hypothetical protein